jgi:hypothetical protein
MSSDLDPYTAAAQNDNVTPQEKISGLHNILKSAKIGMLTTRSPDGGFHSRAMTPTSRTSFPYAPLHIPHSRPISSQRDSTYPRLLSQQRIPQIRGNRT